MNMKVKMILVFIAVISISCKSRNENIYVAENLRDYKDNKITYYELDSLISNSPYWTLDKYKTTNSAEAFALELIKDNFKNQGLKCNEFYICDISNMGDSVINFNINHIDGLVYKFKINMSNEIPATGNVTGLGAIYSINIISQKIEITPWQ